MRNLGAWAVLVFVGALAVVIGLHLDETAMAVVIGVIFGVLASVPASLLLIWHITQSRFQRNHHVREYPQEYIVFGSNSRLPSAWSATLDDFQALPEIWQQEEL